ncbi:hypothetical protein CF328_g9033, partial [Tilletia controversa]
DASVEQLARQLADLDVNSAEYKSAWIAMADEGAFRRSQHPSTRRVPFRERHLSRLLSSSASRPSSVCRCQTRRSMLWRILSDGKRFSPPPYSVEVPLVKALRDLGHVPRAQVPSTTNSIIYPQVSLIEVAGSSFSAPISVYGANRNSQQSSERPKPYDRPSSPSGPAARTRSQDHHSSPAAAQGLPPTPASASAPAPGVPPPSAPSQATASRSQDSVTPQAPLSVVGDAEMTEADGEKKRQARRYTLTSNLSRSFPIKDTLQKIIDNPVTISTGELLAQPEVQKLLGPMLQRHRSYETNAMDVGPDFVDVALLEPKLGRVLFTCGVGKVQVGIGGVNVTALLGQGQRLT